MNDFQSGQDFITFDAASPPRNNVSLPLAGPSRSKPIPSGPRASQTPQNAPQVDNLSTEDRKLLALKSGRKDEANNIVNTPETNGNGKGKGKSKDKGKGKEKEQENVNSRKRSREEDTGPRNLKEERRAAERSAPWTDMVDWEDCRDPAEMLCSEIDAYYRYVSPTRAEFEIRLFLIELITRAVHKSWPDAEVTPFGSWQTQLYLPQGDIDLVVSNSRFTESNKARLLAELARAMRQAHITDVVAIISKARVPIIKFVTTEGKLNVDISLNQTNGIYASKIVNQYLDVLPGARQLIMVVKAFLSQRSMNEVYTGGLGSYSVICMVISFLQIHPKLRKAEIDPEKNLGTLLIEFFELYGRYFNYDDVGISIRRGGYYYSKKHRNWLRQGQAFLLSIEDPQDKDNDISGGSFGIRQVKNTLAGAYEMLQVRLFERAEWISRRRAGEIVFRKEDAEGMSILNGVMGVTKETQRHRQQLQKLHEEGRLQRMLGIPAGGNPENYVAHYRDPLNIGISTKQARKKARSDSVTSIDNTMTKKRKTTPVGAIAIDDEDEDSDPTGHGEVFDSDSELEFEDGEIDEDVEDDDEDEEEYLNRRSISREPKTVIARNPITDRERFGSQPPVDSDEELYRQVIHEVLDDSDEEEEDNDSRYAVGRATPRRINGNTRGNKHDVIYLDTTRDDDDDEDDEDTSDSGIVEVSPPPQRKSEPTPLSPAPTIRSAVPANGHTDGSDPISAVSGSQQRDKAAKIDRKAFWAAKGKLDKSDEEFDGDADFVGF